MTHLIALFFRFLRTNLLVSAKSRKSFTEMHAAVTRLCIDMSSTTRPHPTGTAITAIQGPLVPAIITISVISSTNVRGDRIRVHQ
jgi:hypothetical protein